MEMSKSNKLKVLYFYSESNLKGFCVVVSEKGHGGSGDGEGQVEGETEETSSRVVGVLGVVDHINLVLCCGLGVHSESDAVVGLSLVTNRGVVLVGTVVLEELSTDDDATVTLTDKFTEDPFAALDESACSLLSKDGLHVSLGSENEI